MQIASFLPHYQLVCISFDISSFSLISYYVKEHLLPLKRALFALQKVPFWNTKSALFEEDSELILLEFGISLV